MNEDFKYSIFCIDFRDFDSAEDLENLLKEVGLDMIGDSWYDAYLGEWIPGVKVNRVWLDKITLSLIAYETDKQQMFYPSFAQFLSNSKGIDNTFQYGDVEFNHRKDITIDSILDKILEKGTDSLTIYEKNFLDKHNSE